MHSNNYNAPRMRSSEFTHHLINHKFWAEFKKEFPEYKHLKNTELSHLWDDIAETIVQEVVNNPLGVKLGSYTGELKYQYLPYKFKSTDRKASEEEGRTISRVNLNTRGKVGKVKWERRLAVRFNKALQFFGFKPIDKLSRLLKDYTDENPEKIRTSRNTLGGWSVWRQL